MPDLLSPNTYPAWHQLPGEVFSRSVLTNAKRRVIYDLLIMLDLLDVWGSMAEVGVYQGGTALLMQQMQPHRMLHLYDTFSGIPVKGQHDVHNVRDFDNTSAESVSLLLDGYQKISCQTAQLHPGFFPKTFDESASSQERFAFVHVDADQEEATYDALERFCPRLTPGGVIVFDDYRWPNCPGVERAINKYWKRMPDWRLRSFAKYQAFFVRSPFT